MIEIIGKNGAGKTTLANFLYDFGFERNIGYTTRPKRSGEIDGIDYYFVAEEEFKRKIDNNEFIDYKVRNGFYYGISKKDISVNTILVSGDARKIEKSTGYKILKLYINCDLPTRYLRVMKRNDPLEDIFDRFHTENFSYLYDFNAIFVSNDYNDVTDFKNYAKQLISNENPSNFLIPNRKFIEEKIKTNDLSGVNYNDKLLMLLQYEEYILRQLFLRNKDLFSDSTIREYYSCLLKFMVDKRINYSMIRDELYANIDEKKYKLDSKIKRRVL